MKISGFTFIRNGITLDYPFVESIRSLLPLCDEVIVAVGDSSDETRKYVEAINDPKIRIIDTVWDDNMREGGKILAFQTNIALSHISGDWGFYLQGDEVLHEKDYENIRKALQANHDNKNVEGLLFNYNHFYGSFSFLADSTSWYRREIRLIRNIPGMESYKDAQGFRMNGTKIRVKLIDATIFHYGWVRNPRSMYLKNASFHRYWHDDAWMEKNILHASEAEYSLLESLKIFPGTHPSVMLPRVNAQSWEFRYDPTKKQRKLKDKFKSLIFKLTGFLPGEYRNYKLI